MSNSNQNNNTNPFGNNQQQDLNQTMFHNIDDTVNSIDNPDVPVSNPRISNVGLTYNQSKILADSK